jgi:GR25 family glycosyltransferase involved in LPS biosynthesis
MNTIIDKVYIVHYAPLKDRRMRLEESLQKYGITNYEFITDYDRNTITNETIKQYYRGNTISLAPICITISHVEIYKKIIENKYALTLILEDDAILAPDFKERLATYCNDLPSDFEIGFLNDGCNMHARGIRPDQIWYPAKSSRTCCAYLITKGCCEKLVKSSIPFREVIDYELFTQINRQNLKCYWCEPTIVSDGSVICFQQSYDRRPLRYITAEFPTIDSIYFATSNTGLGNTLFQIAATMGIARELCLQPVFPRLEILKQRLRDYFGYDHGDTIFRNVPTITTVPMHEFKCIKEESVVQEYGSTLINRIKESSDHCMIQGNLECFKYFEPIQEEIRELFCIDNKTKDMILEKYHTLFNLPKTLVSIHFHERPNFAFYRRAIDYLCQHVKNPYFVIVTDNPQCVDQSIFRERNVDYMFIENNIDYVEIYIMSMCKHNIISASTFAWWGAFLNVNPDKIGIYDKEISINLDNYFHGV